MFNYSKHTDVINIKKDPILFAVFDETFGKDMYITKTKELCHILKIDDTLYKLE